MFRLSTETLGFQTSLIHTNFAFGLKSLKEVGECYQRFYPLTL